MLFDEIAELTGQRNAIDGRIVDIIAEIDRDGLWGMTGVRSVSALVAWKTGCAPRNADTLVAIARRADQFPRCVEGLRGGRLSLDQVGVLAENAADGSDDHYAPLAEICTVTQLRHAVRLEPRPEPDPRPAPQPAITKTAGGPNSEYTTYRITLPRVDAAKFDAALQSHRDALMARWDRDHDNLGGDANAGGGGPDLINVHNSVDQRVPGPLSPLPTTLDAFMSLVEAGWDSEATRRPHGQHTAVVVHVDVNKHVGELHLGPLLTDAERQYLTCDATCEVWFEHHGRVIGCGRATRTVNRRLRRALEHRDRCCVVPGCAATRGLHAHHIRHWEHGGPTELDNLVLVCPYHHRLHHRGGITIAGTADRLVVTDDYGQAMTGRSLARPPTAPPPAVPPYGGPLGERADWWWYDPFEPQPPPAVN